MVENFKVKVSASSGSSLMSSAMASSATAKLTYESKKRLFDQKVISKHELQLAYNSWLDAQTQISLARAAEASARNNLSYTVVKSPSNGVVGVLPFR